MKRFFISIMFLCLVRCSSTYVLTTEAQDIIKSFDDIKADEKITLLAGTEYETPAFIYDSGNSGTNVLIIGGTHGNEPAGYEAALRLVRLFSESPPEKGKVIIIPMANRRSIINYKRRIPVPENTDIEKGNLNRCYPGKEYGLPMEQMAFQIEVLARENDVKVFIDLHEARYYHLDTPEESNRDQGLGQTIIYYPNDATSMYLISLLDEVNSTIENPNEVFSAVERPILHSAAWWAGEYLDIAAFTFETMRKMDLKKRINYHLSLVEVVLRESGIW
jgi:hypothetical protein